MKKIKAALCAAVMIICSCNSDTQVATDNPDAAQKEAEAFATQFYNKLKQKDVKGTYSMFGEIFYKKSDTVKLQQAYDTALALLGDISGYKLSSCATDMREGYSEFRMQFKVKRTKYDTEESICVVKQNNKTGIAYYFVESESYRIEQSLKDIERSTIIQQ